MTAASTQNPPPSGELGSAVRATSGMILLSRFMGMMRDVLVVQVFGASALGSAFQAAFIIPNLFRRLLGEGALSAAFIPPYACLQQTNPAAAEALAKYTLGKLAFIASILTLIIEVVLLALILFLPVDAERMQSFKLMMIVMPFMPAVCFAAIQAGMLQVHRRFSASMAGPLLLNGLIIAVAGLYLIAGWKGDILAAILLCGATVLAGFGQVAFFAGKLKGLRHALTEQQATDLQAPTKREAQGIWKNFTPVLLGLGGLQISTLLDLVILMWPIWIGSTILGMSYPLDDASNAIYRSSQLLYQFPLGVFGIAVATAAFPMLSRAAANNEQFAMTLQRSMRLSLFIGLPASLGLMLVSSDLTRTLYSFFPSRGFDDAGASRAALVLMLASPAVFAFSLNHVLTRAFYAKQETKIPMRISLIMVAVNFAVTCLLLSQAGKSIPFFSNLTPDGKLREAIVALSSSLCGIVQCLWLSVALRKHLGMPRLFDHAGKASLLRLTATSLLMAAACGAIILLWNPGNDRWQILARLITTSLAGGVVYLAISAIWNRAELSWLIARKLPPQAKAA
jgi:putative peptidoglycan lipid II flippase